MPTFYWKLSIKTFGLIARSVVFKVSHDSYIHGITITIITGRDVHLWLDSGEITNE